MTIDDMLGENFLPFLALALGAALVLGNGLALLRPNPNREDGELDRPPLARTIIQMVIGGIASLWSIATILT